MRLRFGIEHAEGETEVDDVANQVIFPSDTKLDDHTRTLSIPDMTGIDRDRATLFMKLNYLALMGTVESEEIRVKVCWLRLLGAKAGLFYPGADPAEYHCIYNEAKVASDAQMLATENFRMPAAVLAKLRDWQKGAAHDFTDLACLVAFIFSQR